MQPAEQPHPVEDKATRAERKAREAAEARRDHDAEVRRVDANTERLRALRLARDASEAAVGKTAKAGKTAKTGKTAKAGETRVRPKAKTAKSIPVAKLNASNDI